MASIRTTGTHASLALSLRHFTFILAMDGILMNNRETGRRIFVQQLSIFNEVISSSFRYFQADLRRVVAARTVETTCGQHDEGFRSSSSTGLPVKQEETATMASDLLVRETEELFQRVHRALGIGGAMHGFSVPSQREKLLEVISYRKNSIFTLFCFV